MLLRYLALITLVFTTNLGISQDAWLTSIDEGFTLAEELNKKVLIEVGSETSDGYIFIENEVWNDSLVEAELQYYVPVSVVLDYRSSFYRKHEIGMTPCLLIFDAEGNKLYQKSGLQSRKEISDVLRTFHFNTKKLNRLNRIYTDSNDKMGRIQKSEEYLNLYFQCPESMQAYFRSRSISHSTKLEKLFDSNEKDLKERVRIIEAGQLLMDYKLTRSISQLEKQLARTESSKNKSLAYYYLIIANRLSANSIEATKYRNELDALKVKEPLARNYAESLDKLAF